MSKAIRRRQKLDAERKAAYLDAIAPRGVWKAGAWIMTFLGRRQFRRFAMSDLFLLTLAAGAAGGAIVAAAVFCLF